MGVDSSLLSTTLPATTLTAAWLAPGFLFHPTDEELVSYYLISTSMSFGTFQLERILKLCKMWMLLQTFGWMKVGTNIVKTVHIIEKETCSEESETIDGF
ncbi:unnamed protein product [Brassica oleracea]|uniref:(rape) hypothetical protein n=1 Tax=Brassica napus TaxID=3708 RepID=A0A816I7E2_BRANA|nr:unnamed protein product [Brassica napus]